MASAVGKPLPPINVGLKMPAPASAFDASIVQPVMAPLPSVDKDIPFWKFATPVPVISAAALGSVDAKVGIFPRESPIVQPARLGEDTSLAFERLAPSGALKVSEATV